VKDEYRKSYTLYLTVTLPMTLSDPKSPQIIHIFKISVFLHIFVSGSWNVWIQSLQCWSAGWS